MPRRKTNFDKNIQKQVRSILKETDNPAIVQDVLNTEFGVIPGSLEEINHQRGLNAIDESIVQNTTDGKTWNPVDDD